LRDVLPIEVLDPNVLFCDTTALNQAVNFVYAKATDPDPRVVRQLVFRFGADLLFNDAKGRTALDILTATAAKVKRKKIKTDAAHADWKERVANTAEILRRDRDVAVHMRRLPASDLQLHQLHRDTLQRILD
jgi:hypothetical protein